jgi:four helix bundle protein
MKNEAGLRPMKRGFTTRKGNFALRFMATELPLHRSCKASASYSRSECFIGKTMFCAILYPKDGDIMANDKLAEQSMDFAVQIINLVKQLKEQRESIISNQIGRSGTSIGANIREAKYAHGTADFISKMQIALKEANETGYWLELLYKTNYIEEEQYNSLEIKCKSLRAMLVASINTAKNNK